MKKLTQLLLIILCTILIVTPYYTYAIGENEENNTNENENLSPTPSESPEPSEDPSPSEPPSTSDIKISNETLSLKVGDSATLSVTPENVTVTWSSSNENIATVSNGKVTANEKGEAVITATVGTKSVSCTVKVRDKGSDATLKSLNISNGTLNQSFDSDIEKYNVTVTSDVTSLKIQYELSDSNAGYLVTGNSNLKNGSIVKLLVTAENGTKKTYELTIVKDETSLDLKKLEINGYALNESFDPEKTQYTASIPYEIETISVTASPKDSNASVKVSGLTNLKVGSNTVTITVTDKEGNTKKYQISVTREKEVSVDENSTSIITSSMTGTSNQTSNGSTTIPKNNSDSDNFLKYAIVSLACLILFAIGGIGIYFYLKTSPKKLKKALEAMNKTESPIVEVTTEDIAQKQKTIEKAMQEDLIQTKEFDINKSETENLSDDKDV